MVKAHKRVDEDVAMNSKMRIRNYRLAKEKINKLKNECVIKELVDQLTAVELNIFRARKKYQTETNAVLFVSI